MDKRIRSLSELKHRFRDTTLFEGMEHSRQGRHAQAVECFDSIGDIAALDIESRSSMKTSFGAHGKHLQQQGQIGEALRCFLKAREVDRNDALLIERTRLLATRPEYGTSQNVSTFRRAFGLGTTAGGLFQQYEFPFLENARQCGMLQRPARPVRSDFIEEIHTIGVYRIPAQGRHLLSQKIRDYKGGNSDLASPFAWLIADFVRSETTLLESVDLIVPMPSNPNKYVGRGFVPSLLVSKELSRSLAVPSRELFFVTPMNCRFREISYEKGKELIKYKDSKCQKAVGNRVVLLVDDVVTKGTTLTLIADILRSIGATNIYAIVLARTGAPANE